MTEGNGEVVSDFTRDALHRETGRSQGVLVSEFAYDPAGRLKAQRTLRTESATATATGATGAGRVRDAYAGLSAQQRQGIKGYDDLRRLMSGLIERQYDYDRSGQLQHIMDRQRGLTKYGYDAVGRITTSVIGYGKDWGGHGTHMGTGSAQIPVAANESFAWDAASNPVQAGQGSAAQTVTRFFWDAAHQLQSVKVTRGADADLDATLTTATTQVFDYGYDALGRRIAKTDAFGTTTFLWAGRQ